MKILITGATGYIGNRLAHQLAIQENIIHILVRDVHSANMPDHKNIHVFKGDITRMESIEAAIKGCSQVYHCAAIAKFTAEKKVLENINVTGTRNMLAASLYANIQRFVFTSSASVFGPSASVPMTENDPRVEPFESEYDLSKYMAENLVRKYIIRGLDAVIVNPSRIYGPGPATYSNAVNRTIRHILRKKIILFPAIDQYITNYCYIDDVIDGHILAMQKGRTGENYILGGENISYTELLQSVRNYIERRNYVFKIPVPLLKSLAGISCILFKNPAITPSIITRFAKHRMLNCDKAINTLGYRITPFKEGLQTTISFLNNSPHQLTHEQAKFNYYGKDQISARTSERVL